MLSHGWKNVEFAKAELLLMAFRTCIFALNSQFKRLGWKWFNWLWWVNLKKVNWANVDRSVTPIWTHWSILKLLFSQEMLRNQLVLFPSDSLLKVAWDGFETIVNTVVLIQTINLFGIPIFFLWLCLAFGFDFFDLIVLYLVLSSLQM